MNRTYIKVYMTVGTEDREGGIYLDAISGVFSCDKGKSTAVEVAGIKNAWVQVRAPLEVVEQFLLNADNERPKIIDWRQMTGRKPHPQEPQRSLTQNFQP